MQTDIDSRATSVTGILSAALLLAWSLGLGAADRQSDVDASPGQFGGAVSIEYPDWFKESFLELGEDVAEAAQANRRVLVIFHQDGCPYCSALVERNLAQRDIEAAMRENFDVIAINMWGDREVLNVDGSIYSEKEFAAALRVQFTPTLIFMNERGHSVLRLNGYVPPERFRLALAYVLGRKEKEVSYREFIAAHAPPPSAGDLNAQPFFASGPIDLAETKRPIAVFFEQKQCPDCDTLHGRVLGAADTRTILESFHCVQLDMWSKTPLVTPAGDKTTARDWATALQVKYAPTLVLFDRTGTEIIRSEAFFKKFHIHGILEYVRSEGFKGQPSFQRWLSARAEHLREQGVDVNIWE